MKKILVVFGLKYLGLSLYLLLFIACKPKTTGPSADLINEMKLKRGELIMCSGSANKFGKVEFETSCDETDKSDFNLAMELLHSFEYDEAEKIFAKIIDRSGNCAMAYWGIAMCNFHPLWTAPTEAELIKGSKAIAIAKSISTKTNRENMYIHAIDTFYKHWNLSEHLKRCKDFETAMHELYVKYPEDKEAAIFYALALDASASPLDKSYSNQKKAGEILNSIYPTQPDHPGILHYIIHTYDYPGLANLGLEAAKKYANIAPASAHACHMPSHIFTRLGLWNDCIQSNKNSVEAARCYAESSGITGHWDEELHGLDYLMYAYLQKAQNDSATALLKYVLRIDSVYPANFKVAYAFAAIPSRFYLENKNWKEAASLKLYPPQFPWNKFPWQESILHFTRIIALTHLSLWKEAENELTQLRKLKDNLIAQKDEYKSKQLEVAILASEALLNNKTSDKEKTLQLFNEAVLLEDSMDKHPVTPGEVVPVRELLASWLLENNKPKEALVQFKQVLIKSPNRFNSLYGAALASEKISDLQNAENYYRQLIQICVDAGNLRPELQHAKKFLKI
jgi:tetratricopeptide (TPR) repeat protein